MDRLISLSFAKIGHRNFNTPGLFPVHDPLIMEWRFIKLQKCNKDIEDVVVACLVDLAD